jgi:hypothetical protein
MRIVMRPTIGLIASLAIVPAQADCPEQIWRCTVGQLALYNKPAHTNRPVAIAFPNIGRVLFTPRVVDELTNFRCTIEVRSGRSNTVLNTIGGKETNSGECGPTAAIGRVPGPADTFRVAIIYITYLDPNERAFYAPVIIYRTRQDSRWRVDATLGRELIAAGATDSIADIRKYLTAQAK